MYGHNAKMITEYVESLDELQLRIALAAVLAAHERIFVEGFCKKQEDN